MQLVDVSDESVVEGDDAVAPRDVKLLAEYHHRKHGHRNRWPCSRHVPDALAQLKMLVIVMASSGLRNLDKFAVDQLNFGSRGADQYALHTVVSRPAS